MLLSMILLLYTLNSIENTLGGNIKILHANVAMFFCHNV